jgi:hypothetical protein
MVSEKKMMKNAVAVVYGRIAVISVILLLGLVGSAHSQERYLRLEGHVQWIAGQTMILATNTDGTDSYIPRSLWTIRVDLTRVPLDEYAALAEGDLVTVTGVLSDDNSRLLGTSIERPEG